MPNPGEIKVRSVNARQTGKPSDPDSQLVQSFTTYGPASRWRAKSSRAEIGGASTMVDPYAPLFERLRESPRLREPGWVLLPLRMFLGVTFVYASLTKFTDPTYLDFSSATSVHAQMIRAAATSPIGPIVNISAHFAALTGLAIAFGELAVGVGVLLGLWTRVAALGGLLLSLSFFLTVSWKTSPYFFGSDIVFVFAWTPLVIAGDGGVLSAVSAIRVSVRRTMGLPATNQRTERPAVTAEVRRRTFVLSGATAAGAGVVALFSGGLIELWTHLRGNGGAAGTGSAALPVQPSAHPRTSSTAATTPASKGATSAGTEIGPTSTVPVGGAASFTDPHSGQPAFVVQPVSGQFKAFNAVCPHAGCPVQFQSGNFFCPCHGSQFDGKTGAVVSGPAPTGLPTIPIAIANGKIYET
jgi:thiosulfate dehydrogenase (quinone) large subunit